jgi:hypothetical protein
MSHRLAELRDEVAAAIDEIEQSAKELDLEPAAPAHAASRDERVPAAFEPDLRDALRITAAVMPARRQPAAQPSRAWTIRAAMAPVPTAIAPARSVREGQPAPGEAPPPIDEWRPHRGRRAAVRTVLALLVAAAAAFVAVNLLHIFPNSSGPPGAHAPRVTLTSLRPVAVAAAQDAATAPTRTSFPGGTATVFLDVRYQGNAAATPLQIAVSARPAGATSSTSTGAMVLNRNFLLDGSGDTVISLTAPAGAFAPGAYVVVARVDGTVAGTCAFVVG